MGLTLCTNWLAGCEFREYYLVRRYREKVSLADAELREIDSVVRGEGCRVDLKEELAPVLSLELLDDLIEAFEVRFLGSDVRTRRNGDDYAGPTDCLLQVIPERVEIHVSVLVGIYRPDLAFCVLNY